MLPLALLAVTAARPPPSPPLQIAQVVAAQKVSRESLAGLKSSGSSGAASSAPPAWVCRPGGVWLALPPAAAERVLRHEQQALAGRLDALFVRQRSVLSELEREGLSPEHFTPT